PGGNSIRTNMSRVLLGKATFGERQSALKDPESAPDLGDVVPQGRGLIETSGSPIRIIQSWYDHPIQDVLAGHMNDRVEKVAEADKLDLEPFMPKAEEHIAEGAVITNPQPDAVELDEMELDLDDLELPAEDMSDLDLGDLEQDSSTDGAE